MLFAAFPYFSDTMSVRKRTGCSYGEWKQRYNLTSSILNTIKLLAFFSPVSLSLSIQKTANSVHKGNL